MKKTWEFLRSRGWHRWIIGAAVAFPLLSVGSVELTSQNWFCDSCHIMNPYYASWRSGAHREVDCVKCHINPGVDNFLAAKFNGLGQVVDDVLHRTSMKPSTSVSQLACTRSGCHDVEKVRTTQKTEGKYLFRHDKHLDLEYTGIQVACSTCHSHVKGSEHFEVNTNVCVTCHLLEHPHENIPSAAGTGIRPTIIRLAVRESLAPVAGTTEPLATPTPPAADQVKVPPNSCATCHNPPPGTIEHGALRVTHSEYLSYGAACESCHRGTTAVPVPIESGQCLECHDFGIERVLAPDEMHRVHSAGKHKIECFNCHGTIHHGPTAQTGTLEQFDCRRCHNDQHGVQRRTYLNDGSGVPGADGAPVVSPMFLAHVDCTGCHIKPRPVSVKPSSGATVAAASPEACNKCHRQGFGEQMIPLWQKTTHTLYDLVSTDLAALEAQLGNGTDAETLAEVHKLLELVRIDGSWGVHNPRYTQQVLEQARDKLSAVRAQRTNGGTP